MDDAAREVGAIRARLDAIEGTARGEPEAVYFRAEDIPDAFTANRGAIFDAMAAGRVLRKGQTAPDGATIWAPPSGPDFTPEQIAAMTPEEYARNRAAVLAWTARRSAPKAAQEPAVPPAPAGASGMVGPQSGLTAADVAEGVRRFGVGWYAAYRRGQALDPRAPR